MPVKQTGIPVTALTYTRHYICRFLQTKDTDRDRVVIRACGPTLASDQVTIVNVMPVLYHSLTGSAGAHNS